MKSKHLRLPRIRPQSSTSSLVQETINWSHSWSSPLRRRMRRWSAQSASWQPRLQSSPASSSTLSAPAVGWPRVLSAGRVIRDSPGDTDTPRETRRSWRICEKSLPSWPISDHTKILIPTEKIWTMNHYAKVLIVCIDLLFSEKKRSFYKIW